MLTMNDGRSELWQWDTGRTLAVDADCSQVHFSNKVFGRSIDVDVIDGTAIIPDILLQTDKDLNVWAFVGTAENGYTKISKTFKVNRRNKPADYVFTPPDQNTLAELSERLDKIEESQDPDAIKNAVDDYLKQNPVEVPVQSVNGQIGAVELTAENVGAISQDDLQTATNEALAQAKASGEFDGADGKSAYQYAVEGGYTGTEAAFAAKMAEEMPDKLPNPNALTFTGAVAGSYDGSAPMSVNIPTVPTKTSQLTNDSGFLTSHQSLAAYRTAAAQDEIDSGKVDKVTGKGLSTNDYTASAKAKVDAIPANPKYTDTVYDDTALKERVATIEGKESAWDAKSDFSGSYNDLTDKPTIPTALPNPNALTFTGAVTGSYDGSTAKTVNIPSAVTDDHINSLIDAKLGVIENGSY